MKPARALPAIAIRHNRVLLGLASEFRLAQVSLPSAPFDGSRYFEPQERSGLKEFRPEAIAGTTSHLFALAKAEQSGELHLCELQHSIHVLTAFRDSPLNANRRDLFWWAWGVPVYEILLDEQHYPLAAECEAHEGWHQQPGVRLMEIAAKYGCSGKGAISSEPVYAAP